MTPSSFKIEKNCRGCGSATLQRVLPLGEVPLANSLLNKDQIKERDEYFPLTLALCTTCSLAQIEETIDPEKLFRNYFYQSSFSQTTLQHAAQLADAVVARFKLNDKSLVAEIASNDGYLLKNYKKQGVPVIGIEPAQNIAKIAVEQNGVPTIAEFFGRAVAEKMVRDGVRADIIHANNVLAHVPAINDVLAGFRTLLKPDGSVISESPYLRDMINKLEFDTIYHEHLFYYSLKSQDFLFKKAGLTIYDVEEIDIHGGSLRIFAKPSDSPNLQLTPRLQALMQAETKLGVDTIDYFLKFKARVEKFRTDIRAQIADLKAQGKRIAAYGASAKGSTLIHYCDIGNSLDYIVDKSTLKQNHFCPGYHLPIHDPKFLLEDKPDYVLLLTWNFADEILKQQETYRKAGGQFIVPIPEIKIV